MTTYIDELRKLVGTRPLLLCGANVILLDGAGRLLLQAVQHRLAARQGRIGGSLGWR